MPNWHFLSEQKRELLKYLIAGCVNTAFGYGVYALALICGLPYVLAALISQILGGFFNYLTYGIFVFRQRPRKEDLIRFTLQYGVYYAFTLVLLTLLQAWGLNAYTAGVVNTLIVPVLAYFSNKYFVFKKKNEAGDA